MTSPYRFPSIYLSHGGGPWPFVETGFASRASYAPLEHYLRGMVSGLPERPKAIVIVSAHWEESQPTVMSAPHPPMLYDYGGFPAAAYALQWPAPGAPQLAEEVRGLLAAAGFATASNATRGFDHGTFVPLMLAVPQANIPCVQLSLLRSLDAAQHFALGAALAPLRTAGVLLIGSGSSYHNMRGFGRPESAAASLAFDNWLVDAVTAEPEQRKKLLIEWERAPSARACHPREEHLLPLQVMAGAARQEAGSVPLRCVIMAVHNSVVQFG